MAKIRSLAEKQKRNTKNYEHRFFHLRYFCSYKTIFMKVLLSPAKNISTDNIPAGTIHTHSTYLKEAGQLVSKLKKMKEKKLAEMMHISMDLATLNVQRYKNWEEPIELKGDVVPAVYAFNGEVYKGLDARSLKPEELDQLQGSVRILSGLYGIMKPLDLMFPYRLEMGTKWQISPKHKNLYHFWGSKLSSALNAEMEKDEVIINLASSEYFKAIDQKKLKAKVITPVFKEFKNGQYSVVMMYAKHARGAMARHIVQNLIQDPEQLKLYNVDGYMFDVNQSTEKEWVFTR